MTQKERADRVLKSLQLITEARKLIDGIVWEGDEGKSDNFEKLQKNEQLMLCICHNNLKSTFTSLDGLYNACKDSTFSEETL